MERLLRLMSERQVSDAFLTPGSPVHVKVQGHTAPINGAALDAAGIERLLRERLSERQWQEFLDRRELNTACTLPGVGTFRISVFQQRGTAAAVRPPRPRGCTGW